MREAELCWTRSRTARAPRELEGDGGSGVYRLLFRVLASRPEEVSSFYEDTIAPLVRHDENYRGDLLQTLEAYFANDCNMNSTARAIYAHRHTVAYRLERVKELTGLDPAASEDRERLGLGLKALRIVDARAVPSLSDWAKIAGSPGDTVSIIAAKQDGRGSQYGRRRVRAGAPVALDLREQVDPG